MVAVSNGFAQQPQSGDYRSAATGNWGPATTWERYDGSSWIAASGMPSSSDGVITIRNLHTVTADASVAVDQVIIEAGGTLSVNAGQTLTVANGADSLDMLVSGTVLNYGTITPTGRLSFEEGAIFYSRVGGGGVVPTATWGDGSTCEIDSVGTTVANVTSQSFYHFTWNCPNQSQNIGLNFPDGYVFRGNVTITNTNGNTRQWRFANISSGTTRNIYIRGDVIVNGANAMLTATGSASTDTTAVVIINVGGDISVSAGVLNLVSTTNPYAEWKVKGNVTVTGGTLTAHTSAYPWRRTLTFVKSGVQSFSVTTPGTIGTALTYRTANPATIVGLNFPWTLSGIIKLDSGKIVTSATNSLTIPAGGGITSGSASGYVDGPLVRTVASTSSTVLTFPIGKESLFRPVTLTVTQDVAAATTYKVELFSIAPPLRILPQTLDAVSSKRYVNIVKGAGANVTSATIQMSYDVDDNILNKDSVRIARDDGAGNWVNSGGSGTANVTGTITSNVMNSLNANTDFVLAHASPNAVIMLPTVTTTTVDTTYISTSTAHSGGNVLNDGGGAVSARGVCWNTSGAPTIFDYKTSDGVGTGVFSSNPMGLIPGTKYFVRAYATNCAGTGYGNEVTFTTMAALVVPTVTTTNVSNIVGTTASSGGNVVAWGGTPVVERGVCWGTLYNPTIGDETTVSGSGLGSFTSSIGGLNLGATYYVRAYAINTTGTGYGNEVSFSTPRPQPDSLRIVAKDGTGNHTTVKAALAAVPSNYTGKWTIYIKKGTYYEKLVLDQNKSNVTLIGEDRDNTILVYDDYAGKAGIVTTSDIPSTWIRSDDFTAMNLTFQNTSHDLGQALALMTDGDREAFYNCRILGYQDTYLGNGLGRVYFKKCYIEGTVDFIYGRSIMVFDSCTVRLRRDGGYLTAASTEPSERFGINFLDCKIVADSIGYNGVAIANFYLGRPWQSRPQVVFVRCEEPATVHPAGWLAWNVTPALYAEYNCFGPGYRPTQRVSWSVPQLADSEGVKYTVQNIFSKYSISPAFASNWRPTVPVVTIPTSINEGSVEEVPYEFGLWQNYPNPFNPGTVIRFQLPVAGTVTLKVFDILGREIATLVNGFKQAGVYDTRFSMNGSRSSGGVFFCRMQAGDLTLTKKMLLIK